VLRFAPTPTEDMSINSLRVAIINYVVSQQNSDQFSIRIEDLNSEKNLEGKDTEIMMILEKFALKHTSVFHQSEHLNLYQTLALRLLKEKKAFLCTCNSEAKETTSCLGACDKLEKEDYATLKESSKKFLIRLKPYIVDKKVADTIIVKENGLPSYDFACACDDMMSDVTMVIRDEKYLTNKETQIAIKKLLGYEKETEYVHIPTIVNADNISVKALLLEGFIPDAILNYLLLIGTENTSTEIFHLPEAIKSFKLENVLSTSLTFEKEKLKFINREHLKLMDDKQLSTLFGFADADIGKLGKVYLEECSTINELEEKIRAIFKAKDFTGVLGEEMKIISELIFSAPAFETFDKLQKYLETKSDLPKEKLTNVLQQLLTGAESGPQLSDIYPFIKSYILEVAS